MALKRSFHVQLEKDHNMSDKKISQLDEATVITNDDLVPIVDDPSGTPITKKITFANLVASISAITSLASLIVTGSLYLSSQPAGRILYTESGGAATTTQNLTYTTTTQVLGVPNLVVSTSGTVSGFSFDNATGTNATTTKIYSSRIGSENFDSQSTTTFTNHQNYLTGGETAFIFDADIGDTDYYVKFVNGVKEIWLGANGQFFGTGNSGLSYPTYSFINDIDTGFYKNGARDIGFVIDGGLAIDFFQDAAHTTTTIDMSQVRTCQKWKASNGTAYYIYMSPNGGFVTSTSPCS